MSTTNINSIPANIPPDVIKGHIFPCWESKDLPAIARVCKAWNQHASSDTVWKPLFQKTFPYNQMKPTPSAKEQYKAQLLGQYPAAFLEIFGGAKEFNKLPVLDTRNNKKWSDYIDYFQQAQLTALIMRGMDDEFHRPFIVFKTKSKETDSLGFVCIFQRYGDYALGWACGQRAVGSSVSTRSSIEYYAEQIRLLVNGEHPELVLAE